MASQLRRTLVVVLNYNGRDLLRPCLDSLADLKDRPDVRVLVVDNASPDGSLAIVEREYPWVIAVQNGGNVGFAKGNNAILARYEADDYVLLNNDTEALPGWLGAMRREAAAPDVGIVGAKLLFPDGRVQHGGGLVDARGPRHHGYLGNPTDVNETKDVDYVTFAAALIKRELIEKIGYLDEGFAPMYYEDADYCFRARAAGFRVRYAADAVLIHKESAAAGAQPSRERLLVAERSRLRLKFLHFPKRWWLRGALYELRKLAGNARDGTLGTLAQAWRENLAQREAFRARRRDLASFVPSAFSPLSAHAPTVRWPLQASDR